MGLGVAATSLYLTATYKRSASLAELASPILPGLPLLGLGILGAIGVLRPVRRGTEIDVQTVRLLSVAGVRHCVGGVMISGDGGVRRGRRTDQSARSSASRSASCPGDDLLGVRHSETKTFRVEEPSCDPSQGRTIAQRPIAEARIAGHAGDGRADQADLELHLPIDAGRNPARGGRDVPGRLVGRRLLGSVLGLGPQGGLGLDHLAGLPDPAPRPVRGLGQHVLAGDGLGRLLPVGPDGLVRGQLRARESACTATASPERGSQGTVGGLHPRWSCSATPPGAAWRRHLSQSKACFTVVAQVA